MLRLLTFLVSLTIAVVLLNAQSNCPQCPTGNQCACIDCSACNSGNFQIMCVCHPVTGHVSCDTSSGSCGQCGYCRSTSGRTICTSYIGCSTAICPPGGCTNGSVRMPGATTEMAECRGCTTHVVSDGDDGSPRLTSMIPVDVPLEISEIVLDSANNPTGIEHFRVRNNGRSGLVSLVTAWTFQDYANPPHEVTTVSHSDSWASDSGFIAPAAEDLIHPTVRISGRAIKSISAKVLYAEFEDGSRTGPGKEVLHDMLSCSRQKLLMSYEALLSRFRNGEDLRELEKTLMLPEDPELYCVKSICEKKGMDAVLEELYHVRRLKP